MSTETKLWGLYVPGIDHCFAYSSKAECETHAAKYPAPAMVVGGHTLPKSTPPLCWNALNALPSGSDAANHRIEAQHRS